MEHKLKINLFTFLHVLRPGFGSIPTSNTDRREYLLQIKKKFEEFMRSGILVQDETEGYYIYRQIKDNQSQTGIIGCISIDDYFSGVIKKHEDTLRPREEKLKNYLSIVDINAEPVCFAYDDHSTLNDTILQHTSTNPLCDFSTTNEIRHQLWAIDDPQIVEQVRNSFSEIDSIYIADGHHRSASSCLLGEEKRVIRGKPNGELSDYFMGIFMPSSELKIMDFNRLIKDLNGMEKIDFLKRLMEKMKVEKIEDEAVEPKNIHEVSMYLDKEWYKIQFPDAFLDDDNPVNCLDAEILNQHVLNPILGIKDIRNDKRVDFLGGHQGMIGLEKKVDSGRYKVAFALHPVTIEQLKAVADNGQVMPPKSTWIEPKLRSGLTIYSLSK